ncbi:2Fe-2S iron-sulfur cluster-binding protein [Shinella sp. BYT-45]|uniref:2Fe-2S iron-sulfur cluster-binding protein n=1 Tax=Shinella sp. BYT-45 TaxID=3377377 RepID=UPI00397FFD15
MTRYRLAKGLDVDRARPVRFTFDGRAYAGLHGDTLASALLAAGNTLFGRSFKYHRPRGLLSAGIEEPNALVTVLRGDRREPNLRATEVELFDGLVAESQNRFPSLDFDVHAVNGMAGKILSAGFYYKTFMGPKALGGTRFWHVCEGFIRRAAGLGKAGEAADPDRYEKVNAFADVLVAGGGVAGMRAALAASESGARVILAHGGPNLGGIARWSGSTVDGQPANEWIDKTEAELRRRGNVRILLRCMVWGAYDGSVFAALEKVSDHRGKPAPGAPRQRHWVIRTESVVHATGAHERPLVFPGNDRPGVMLAASAARYASQYAAAPGRRVVVFTNNDSAYASARILHAAGVSVSAIADLRPAVPDAAKAIARDVGAELLVDHVVVATRGRRAIDGVVVRSGDGSTRRLACDCLAISGGWSPAIQLATHGGSKPVWNAARQCFTVEGAAGMAAAEFDFGPGLSPNPADVLEVDAEGKAFVDFQHDVTTDDIRLAHREGFSAIEHLKRYTTLGMATDQGRSANVAAMAMIARLTDRSVEATGTTRFRPPVAPVPVAALAAERKDHVRAIRRTPMHDWHLAHGAEMMPSGLWQRPRIYRRAGETLQDAITRETLAVRQGVGLVDVSTLGKIMVQGPDAGAFLDRIYANRFSTLLPDRARYGVMLREDGHVMDDGTVWRLSENDWFMTTSTGQAGNVLMHLEYCLDILWPDLKVAVCPVTDEWAGMAIAGPKSRDVLEACVSGIAVSDEALPRMGIVHGSIADRPVMVARLSFSGERAFEVFTPAGNGLSVWQRLLDAGAAMGITPYGIEALDTLRIEKGHLTAAEIDGRTTARDLGLAWALSKEKPFVGKVLMERPGLNASDRLQLVGLIPEDGQTISGGAHITERSAESGPVPSLGHVTSACLSPSLGRPIALGLLSAGRERLGQVLWQSDPLRSRFGKVRVVSPHFFDPEGERQNG